MNISAGSAADLNGKLPHSLIIHTTLYDLIAAINAEVDADEEDLVVARVVHLVKTHRLTYLGTPKPGRLIVDHIQAPRQRNVATTARCHSETAGRWCRRLQAYPSGVAARYSAGRL